MFVLRCQYQYKRLTGHCRLRNGETCVAGHVTPYSHSLSHSPHVIHRRHHQHDDLQ